MRQDRSLCNEVAYLRPKVGFPSQLKDRIFVLREPPTSESFKSYSCSLDLHINTSAWMVAKQQLYHEYTVWEKTGHIVFWCPASAKQIWLISVWLKKEVLHWFPLSPLFLSTGSGLTMTFIPRAQTFPSFLSDEPEREEESQRQEEAPSPSSGCESSCSPRALQWQRIALPRLDTLPSAVERL